MTGLDCHAVRVELTEFVLHGQPLPARLARHVSTCPACAMEVGEIGDVVRTLQLAEPDSLGRNEITAMTPSTQEAITLRPDLGVRIAWQVRSARVARWRRIAVGAAACVILGCAGLIPILDRAHPAPTTGQSVQTVALARVGAMIPQPWGTEVPVALSGLQPGQVYRLMTEDDTGQQTSAGSVRAAGDGPIRTNMMTAMSRASIVALLVEDQQGRQVAHMTVSPPSPGPAPTG
jgi:hypothetical protein